MYLKRPRQRLHIFPTEKHKPAAFARMKFEVPCPALNMSIFLWHGINHKNAKRQQHRTKRGTSRAYQNSNASHNVTNNIPYILLPCSSKHTANPYLVNSSLVPTRYHSPNPTIFSSILALQYHVYDHVAHC